jgi:predicted RNA-binding Zn ribbon-like protein
MRFPSDWLDAAVQGAASDLDLTVLLINSYDTLADPADRLQDLRWWRAVLADVGHARLAAELDDTDLGPLRALREQLREVFETRDLPSAIEMLNSLLSGADVVLLLVEADDDSGTAQLVAGVGRSGLAALQARLPAALAQHVARYGVRRLGTCASDPCHCAFVDGTRGATRRYCCTWCNDRAAARAYRQRNRGRKS